jgi:hypothetical protein
LLMVMPWFAVSKAMLRLIPIMADLAALYAASPGMLPKVPVVDETLMMRSSDVLAYLAVCCA